MPSQKRRERPSDLRGDYGNIAFLLLLYVLQGIPIGLSSAIPLLLQNRKVSYTDQALFSFVTWPFSLKLLWAPIVDSIYWRWLGRRKSWLIPVQLGIGIFMLLLSQSIHSYMTDDPTTGVKPDIRWLTFIFLILNFLAATQDIAVDGWALTMLKRRNVGYASTCNTVGQTAGYFLGNVIFLALESASFCNKYLRSPEDKSEVGVITLESFLHHNGLMFVGVTLLVAFIKKEKSLVFEDRDDLNRRLTRSSSQISKKNLLASSDNSTDDSDTEAEGGNERELNVRETYSVLYKIMKLPSFQIFAALLLTCKIGFGGPDAVSGLKLIEAGLLKENAALLAVPLVPLQIFLPWIISRMTCGPRPLDVFIKAYPYRLLFGLIFPLTIYLTPSFKLEDGTFPFHYYTILVIIYGLHQITVYCMFVSLMAFHAAISDPVIGGTYMTLLNTITNLGSNWPSTAALWLVEKLTFQDCQRVCKSDFITNSTTVKPLNPEVKCEDVCTVRFDGYYTECAICVALGFLWLHWGRNRLKKLQTLPQSSWIVAKNNKKI